MRKIVCALVTIVFFFVTTAIAFAGGYGGGYYRRPHYSHYPSYSYHHGHSDNYWGALGVGLLTGTLLTSVFYAASPRTVVYEQPAPVVVSSPPVVVREYRYSSPQPSPISGRVSVIAAELNVRSGPGTEHPVSAYVRYGEILEVMSSTPGWLYVKAGNGVYGWVMAQYTVSQSQPQG